MATRRRGRGEGSIYQRADGKWVGSIDLGWKDGKRHRKVLYGKTRREVAQKITALLPAADAGQLTTGSSPTVEAWLASWLASAEHRLAPKTLTSYRNIVGYYIVPAVGRKRIDRLSPADIQAMCAELLGKGLSPRVAQYAHAVLRSALQSAVRLGTLRENPAARVEPPRPRKTPVEVFSAVDVSRHGIPHRWRSSVK